MKCARCGSRKVIGWGRRKLLSGWRRRWHCNACGATYSKKSRNRKPRK